MSTDTHPIVLEDGQLDLLLLVLVLLRGRVVLLLALLRAAAQTQHQVERRLLLDVVVAQRPAVLQLLAGEDQPLLVGRNACTTAHGRHESASFHNQSSGHGISTHGRSERYRRYRTITNIDHNKCETATLFRITDVVTFALMTFDSRF